MAATNTPLPTILVDLSREKDEGKTIPLLPTAGPTNVSTKGASTRLTVVNLLNSFLGAGLMALPHAFSGLGFYFGLSVIASITVMMYCGMMAIVECVEHTDKCSLSKIVEEKLGKSMGRLIQLCILLNNFGVLMLYLVVIGDALVGTKEDGFDGLLPTLAHDHTGSTWYISRWFVTLILCFCCVQPLVLQRRMTSLSLSSVVAVVLIGLLTLYTGFLATLSSIDREVSSPIMTPDEEVKEEDITSNCMLNLVIQGLSIYTFAFIAHYNIPPLMHEMENPSKERMEKCVRQAVGFASVVYTVVPVCYWLLFGGEVSDDFLKNLGTRSLERYLPPISAEISSSAISLGYTVVMLCVFPMDNWALRQNVGAIFFGTSRPEGWKFYLITYALLFAVYFGAISVGSVFIVVSFIGCTACSIMGLILPGQLILREKPTQRVMGWVMTIGGLLMFVHGTFGEAWRLSNKEPMYC